RVDEPVRRCEELDPLEKERPLLRKEKLEALVDGHEAGVGLNLTEIRIHGRVDRQVREAEARVHTAARIRRLPDEAAGRGLANAGAGAGDEGLPVRPDAAIEIVQAVQNARLRQKARARPDFGPRILMAGALDLSAHVESPALRSVPLVSQRLERNADLD